MTRPTEVQLITLDPAHFHAALVQKEMLPGIAKRVSIYAPLGPELIEHLKRIERFNSRAANPTAWELEVHCSTDPIARIEAERPGNVVVLAGRNSNKIGKIQAALDAGLNVLADKPWIIEAAQMSELERALDSAAHRGLVAYDMMTERYEITSLVQRELAADREVFGEPLAGSVDEPGVYVESIHHIYKTVAGVTGLRPPFFFDIREEGEGLADVGTHLVDLVPWILFPGEPIRVPKDIAVHSVERWPTPLSLDQYRTVTGTAAFAPELAAYVTGGRLDYYCNNRIDYRLRGIHVRLDVLWNWEAPAGVDLHYAVIRGSNARIEVRQGEREHYRTEVYVVPNSPGAGFTAALERKVQAMQGAWPGVGMLELDGEYRVTIPDRYHVGHEAHFAQVLAQFLAYLREPSTIPADERPNMLAKYHVTTSGSRPT
jgi:predicted dehydrogenase